jgi:hypothetical protein
MSIYKHSGLILWRWSMLFSKMGKAGKESFVAGLRKQVIHIRTGKKGGLI